MDKLSGQKYLTSGYAPLFCCAGWDQFCGSGYANDSNIFLNGTEGGLSSLSDSEKNFELFGNTRNAGKPPSLVDRIQLDFPKTPSFVIESEEDSQVRHSGEEDLNEDEYKSCLNALSLMDVGQVSSDVKSSKNIYPAHMSASMGSIERFGSGKMRDVVHNRHVSREHEDVKKPSNVSEDSSTAAERLLEGGNSSGSIISKKNTNRRNKNNGFQKYVNFSNYYDQMQHSDSNKSAGASVKNYRAADSLSNPINYQLSSDSYDSMQAPSPSVQNCNMDSMLSNSLDLQVSNSAKKFPASQTHTRGLSLEAVGRDYYGHPFHVGPRSSIDSVAVKQQNCNSTGPTVANSSSATAGSSCVSSVDGSSGAAMTNGTPVVKSVGRSLLLEEFRVSKNKKYELKDIVEHFVEFSGDQHGSRFIQQKLETASAAEKQLVFQEIYPFALHLMTDVFGNYVIQKFFEHGTSEQKQKLGEVLEGNVLYLSLQMYGCRVVQKALEVIGKSQKAKLISELDGHVLKCIKDQNGNHVIQKVIEHVSAELVLFVVNTFKGKVCNLAVHPYGCRVIQRILEHCRNVSAEQSKEPGVLAQLEILEELLDGTILLVQDQYGNYVIQHVLEHGRQEDKRKIIQNLQGKILQLSQHKFASNVIEKCVQYGAPEDRKMIIDEILSEKLVLGTHMQSLEVMMNDAYANYVVQKILEVCDSKQRDMLVNRIKLHMSVLKKFTYSKHILLRMEKILSKSQ